MQLYQLRVVRLDIAQPPQKVGMQLCLGPVEGKQLQRSCNPQLPCKHSNLCQAVQSLLDSGYLQKQGGAILLHTLQHPAKTHHRKPPGGCWILLQEHSSNALGPSMHLQKHR